MEDQTETTSINGPQDPPNQEMMEKVKTLTFADKQKVRANISVIRNAKKMDYDEKRKARLAVSRGDNAPPITLENGEQRTPSVPVHWIINAFEAGTFEEFKENYTGVQTVGFNTYQITFDSEENTDKFIKKFETERSAQGMGEEVFVAAAGDFRDPVVSLTFYPIPADFTEAQVKWLVEDTFLGLGKFENVSYGRHKHSKAKNGFVHV